MQKKHAKIASHVSYPSVQFINWFHACCSTVNQLAVSRCRSSSYSVDTVVTSTRQAPTRKHENLLYLVRISFVCKSFACNYYSCSHALQMCSQRGGARRSQLRVERVTVPTRTKHADDSSGITRKAFYQATACSLIHDACHQCDCDWAVCIAKHRGAGVCAQTVSSPLLDCAALISQL